MSPEDSTKAKRAAELRLGTLYGVVVIILIALFAVFAYTATITHTLNQSILENAVAESSSRTDAMYNVMDKLLTRKSFDDINTSADKDTKLYQNLQKRLNETRDMNSTRYFYTAKRSADGTLIYLVDGLDKDAEDFRNPGDPIEDEMVPYLERALNGETVYSQDIIDTDWGHIFTACYPIHDSDTGEVIGVLCIETDMEDTYAFIDDHQRSLTRIGFVAAAILTALIVCAYLALRQGRRKEREDQEAVLESNRKLEEALARETKHTEIISALATIYTTIFQIDVEDGTYEMVTSVGPMHGISGTKGKLTSDVVEGILDAFIGESMRDDMAAFLDLSTMQERLRDANTLLLEYVDPAGRWFQGRIIVKKRNEDGSVSQILYAARDFTDEKTVELELRDTLQKTAVEARRASLSKTSFLRRMSHDIRTPLNGIIGMLRLSDRYADDPAKLKENREKILHSADYLLDLVNNVLDISKLESGALELEHKPFNLGEMLLKIVSTVELTAVENGVKFKGGRESSKLVHRYLIGSPVHVNRVLMNLASNAVKYNRRGGYVNLYAIETASDGGHATYRFVCEDNGLGMSEEFQKRAFEPFAQEGKETTTSFSGSGLGLSIVKDVVEIMGGDIELESREGVGTKITVTLTFDIDNDAREQDGTATQPEAIDLAGKHALLVEDNELNLEIARMMLEEEGIVVTQAANGQEAMLVFEASEMGAFDYIFMDVMMPVMDGLEATRRIRALEREDASSVKIIATTANAFAEDRRACLEAGMDAHLGKPIDAKTLRETLAGLEG